MANLSRRAFLEARGLWPLPLGARAQSGPPKKFTTAELVDNGHRFFGSVSRGLAQVVEEAGRRWGQPNGYVLGQEAGGAFIGGVRYGEGSMYPATPATFTSTGRVRPSASTPGRMADRSMMLVYNLPSTQGIFRRVGGVDGSAYFVGGFGFTALTDNDIIVVPIRSGVAPGSGSALSYLKFTAQPTLEPVSDPSGALRRRSAWHRGLMACGRT